MFPITYEGAGFDAGNCPEDCVSVSGAIIGLVFGFDAQCIV